MKKLLIASLLALAATSVSATEYVVFVHGRSGNHCGTSTTDVNNYWGNAKNISTTLAKYFVGYDGSTDPRTFGSCRAQTSLFTVLEARCKGTNSCVIICHSAGCYATEHFIDKSTTVYNIKRILASSSAAGGSSLANAAFWPSDGMVTALKTANARGSYNHNNMRGIGVYAIAGYKGTLTGASVIMGGEDDGAVAFDSTCGINTTGSFNNCLSGTRYSYHYIWNVVANNSWGSSQNGYYRSHTGDTSNSINDATKNEFTDCKNGGYAGCK